jgi:hypothetical protein
MLKLKCTLNKTVLSKCLLSAAFILYIFTFPVFASDGKMLLLHKVTTELVFTNRPVASKQTFSYKVPVYTKYTTSLFFASSQNHQNALLLHNRLSKIQFHLAGKTLQLFKTTHRFITPKLIPQSGDADIFCSSIG